MNNDLAVRDLDTGLAINREPELVLEEAHRAAAALKRVIESKPNKVMFGGEQYLEFEDWQTVGRFYAIAPRTTATRPLTLGDVSGWEASADAIHVPTGRVIASADAMCMNDEEKWRARPKYEWLYVTRGGGLVADPPKAEMIWEKGADGKSRPKKERVHVGEETVPSFQLRSMAQTRAGAKALRNALAWVVVLAGYRPTPAEELPQVDPPARPIPQAEDADFTPAPRRAPAKATGVPAEPQQLAEAPAPERTEEEPPLDPPSGEETPVESERAILYGRVDGLATTLKLDAADRAKLWAKWCGEATKRNVDPAALHAMYADLLVLKRAKLEKEKEKAG